MFVFLVKDGIITIILSKIIPTNLAKDGNKVKVIIIKDE